MSRLISTVKAHRKDALVVLLTAVAGLGMITYVLSRQVAAPSFLRSGGGEGLSFEAEFSDVGGIVAGMGQPVTVAGVQVGAVGGVELDGRVAVVRVDLDSGSDEPEVYNDATLLVRPRTALKDMSIALEPGTEAAGALDAGGRLPLSQTQPTVNVDDILANLDVDARSYMRLLLSGGAGAFRDSDSGSPSGKPSPKAVTDLNQSLERLEPLTRDARLVTEQLGKRRRNLARTVSGLEQVTIELTSIGADITSLIDGAQRTLAATGSRDTELALALSELPGTLEQTDRALRGTTEFGDTLRTASGNLRPLARSLGPSLKALRPFFAETIPVLRDQLRPQARDVLPIFKQLKPAALDLEAGIPATAAAFKVVAGFFNAVASNPPGSEEGYLFWASWLAHNANSLSGVQDAHGAALRGLPLATCAQLGALRQVELGNPSLSPIIKLINVADRLVVC